MVCCENCKYARLACNKEYIGCVRWIKEHPSITEDDFFTFYGRKEIQTGWVNLKAKPTDIENQGMITNNIPCFKKTDCCKYYKEADK